MGKLINLEGQVFGKLKVLRLEGFRTSPNGTIASLWRCLCDCGNESVVMSGNLRTGGSKSCGCGVHRNKGRSRALPGKATWLNSVWQNYTRGAKDRGFEFALTLAQVEELVGKPCTYCGAPPRNGIDRIDSSAGYTIENSAPCCTICNFMKSTMPVQQFLEHVKKIARHAIP